MTHIRYNTSSLLVENDKTCTVVYIVTKGPFSQYSSSFAALIWQPAYTSP